MIIRFNKILSSILFLSIINPVVAHNIKTDGDVGATFHIEPNHNPRAGETARAWFALTRPGGESIPLAQCDCRLIVRSQSSDLQPSSLPKPSLIAVSAEQYRDIPGADIVFPKAGIYELEISGTPKKSAEFRPFKLSYNVTVLPGKTPSVETQNAPQPTKQTDSRSGLVIAIASLIIIASIGFWTLKGQIKSKGK
jgi:hypothetical protein